MAVAEEVTELYSTYHDRIYRYLLSLVHNAAEAEDLTQDTFMRACCHMDALRDVNAVRGWLYRIATRACVDRWRERVVHVSLETDEGSRSIETVRSASPSALDVAEREQSAACVQRCLDFLSDSYRAVILLHEGHNLTAAEIAEMTGESLGTIKIRLHRARKKLQQIMEIGCAVSHGKDGIPCCEPK